MMLLQENVKLAYNLNPIKRVETQSCIVSFEIIENILYYIADNNIFMYDLENNKTLKQFHFTTTLSAIAIQGDNIYIAQGDQYILQFNIKNQKKNIIAHYKDSCIKKIVVINNLLIYLKYDQAQLLIADIRLNKTIRKIQCFEDYAWDLKTSFKQNKLIAVTYADWVYQGIKIYDLDNFTLFSDFKSDFYYSLVEFSNDQIDIFIVDIIRVRQFNIRTKELIQQITIGQIFGIGLYEQQFFIMQAQQILLVNVKNKDEVQGLKLPIDTFYVNKDQYHSGEFINQFRVNGQYMVWISNKQGKGFLIQRKQ